MAQPSNSSPMFTAVADQHGDSDSPKRSVLLTKEKCTTILWVSLARTSIHSIPRNMTFANSIYFALPLLVLRLAGDSCAPSLFVCIRPWAECSLVEELFSNKRLGLFPFLIRNFRRNLRTYLSTFMGDPELPSTRIVTVEDAHCSRALQYPGVAGW